MVLKERSTGTEQLIPLTNRPVIGSSDQYYPIVQEIMGLGSVNGQYLPQSVSGRIILNNAPNSFGTERRFSDLLERYEIIDQPIIVYTGYSHHDSFDASTLVFEGLALNAIADPIAQTISILVISAPISNVELTRLINTETFPNAPTASIGRYIPLVIGESVEVKPLRVTGAADPQPTYAYATCFGGSAGVNKFLAGSVQSYYIKDTDGVYREFFGMSETSAIITESGADSTYTFDTAELAGTRFAAAPFIITGGHWRIKKDSGISKTGELIFNLYEAEHNDTTGYRPAENPIASAKFDKANLPNDNNNPYDLNFQFNKPVYIGKPGNQYYVTLAQTNSIGTSAVNLVLSSKSAADYWARSPGDNNLWRKYSRTVFPQWGLYPLNTSESYAAADNNGIGYAQFQILQRSAPSHTVVCDLTNIDLLVAVDGIKDDSTGVLTGTPSAPVTRPNQIARLVNMSWNGSMWLDDIATNHYNPGVFLLLHDILSTGPTAREFNGAFTNRTSVADVCETLCKNCACRIGWTVSGFGLYPWGNNIETSAVLTDEDSRITNIEMRGVETIVNNVKFFYGKKLRDINIESSLGSNQFKNYSGVIEWDIDTGSLQAALSTISQSLFGKKPNASAAYDYIDDQQSAEVLAWYLMGMFGLPHTYVTLKCPFIKYQDLEVFDVVEVLHPDLPAFYGTSSNATNARYLGEEANVLASHYMKRAQRYRAQIEGKEIDFNSEGTPSVVLTLRLLTNNPNDPT